MKRTAETCLHLNLEIVREIHHASLEGFGGADGVRDDGMLESAVAAPQASFGGKSVYADAIEVAGAYLFYLCRNHPFIDGNKRTALGACLVFLRLNDISTGKDNPAWESLVLDVAASKLDRDQTTARLRALLKRRRKK
jgi:death-on-curing protein